jgi:hypothetical protein
MVSPRIIKGRLLEGMAFESREGATVIGMGMMIEILNGELKGLSK